MKLTWKNCICINWNGKYVVVFILLTIFSLSSYAFINQPSPLESAIIDVLHIDTARYGILISLCSWASILDAMHGYILDRYLSVKTGTYIYIMILFTGCAVYSYSGFNKSYTLMILGRVIYGLGINPLFLLYNKHVIWWFGGGKYVNAASSFYCSIFWLGDSLVFYATAPILDWVGRYVPADEAFAITNLLESGVMTFMAGFSMLVLALMYSMAGNAAGQETRTEKLPEQPSQEEKTSKTFKDYVCMPLKFWMFALTMFFYYISIFSFLGMSILYFMTKFGVSRGYAGRLSSLITLLPSLFTAPYGFVLDKFGHNLSSLTLAILLNLAAQALLGWTMINPILSMVLMGSSLITVSGIWSQFQFMVKDHQYMIAYGVAQTSLNGAQALGTISAGYIIDNSSYQGFMIYQITLILCCLPIVGTLWYLDWKDDFFINKDTKTKNIILGRYKG